LQTKTQFLLSIRICRKTRIFLSRFEKNHAHTHTSPKDSETALGRDKTKLVLNG